MKRFQRVALAAAIVILPSAVNSSNLPVVSISSSPTSITPGQSSTLTWSSSKAVSCDGNNFTASGKNGSITVSPIVTTLYSITCIGLGAKGLSSTVMATVAVGTVLAVNGNCGAANNTAASVPPATNLCSAGSTSTITGTGPWSWSCAGINGGTTAQCSAPVATQQPMKLGQFGKVPEHWWNNVLYADGLAPFEQWLGRVIDYTVVFGGHDSGWSDFEGSIWYLTELWKNMPARKLIWSVPLIVKQWDAPDPKIANLRDASLGAYDDHYHAVAGMINVRDPAAIIRVGWEFNGDWYPWAAAGQEQDYIAAFRHLVGVFRSISPNFKFAWNPNIGKAATDPELSYPGDDVVDYIASDLYESSQWDTGTPDARWNSFLTRDGRGLDWLGTYAVRHSKPIMIPEYATNYNVGAGGNLDTVFIKNMHDWMVAHNVAIQSYWDSDSAFQGSFESHPSNGAQYKQLYGGQ